MNRTTAATVNPSSRKSKREEQFARTLVHYLGVEKALEACRANTWTGVRRAIIKQQGR